MSYIFKVSMQRDVVVKFKVYHHNQRVGFFLPLAFHFVPGFIYGNNKIIHRGKTPNLYCRKNYIFGREDLTKMNTKIQLQPQL